MNVNLKPIVESKVRQLGGDVCGVLVRKDDKLAAVDEHGRVQWLQSGQGAEPDWSDSKTLESEGWKNPLLSKNDRLQIADGAVAWRDEVIKNLRSRDRQPAQQGVSEEVIKAAVDRFLQWKLPEDFYPDGGVSFDGAYDYDSPHWPVGTNILTAEQAEQMLKECLGAATTQPEGGGWVPEGWKLVPIEPTPDMRRAFHEAHELFEDGEEVDGSPDDEWRGMLDAAPPPSRQSNTAMLNCRRTLNE